MNPWWKNAVPHKDIREGRLDPSVFAVDLGEVADGRGAEEYREAAKFFQRTYMTKGLREVLVKILGTLHKAQSGASIKRLSPVLQLVTPFGGGKTHTLLALYHLFNGYRKIRSLDVVESIVKESGLKEVPKTNVATIDGTHMDVIGGEEVEGVKIRTLWGKIAHELGGRKLYELVKEHDENMVSPGKQKFKEVLKEASPSLIILDELLEYTVKARGVEVGKTNLGAQTMAFLQELTGVVASFAEDKDKSCALVVTLPSSHLERYDESSEKDYQTLKKITARIELRHAPVEGLEIYEILRRRLFDQIKSRDEALKAAEALFGGLKKAEDAIPKEFRGKRYLEKLEKSYPFHPELIDVLYEKWGALPGFQRTRGVLRFLGLILADLYKKNDPNPLVMPGLVDLGNRMVQDELLTYLDEGYASVVDSDIGGRGSKCAAIDRELPTEFEKYQIATRIGTVVFLHSVGKGGTLGVSKKRIRAVTMQADLPVQVVDDALELMRARLWYLYFDEKGEHLYFGKEPGLNRIVTEKMDSIGDEEVREFVHSHLADIAGQGGVYLAPERPNEVPDSETRKYIFAPIDKPFEGDEGGEARELAEKFLTEHLPTSPRKRKNTLIFILADGDRVGRLVNLGREFLAYTEIEKSTDTRERLSERQQKDLGSKLKEVASRFRNEMHVAYSHVLVPAAEGLEHFPLGLAVIREKNTRSCVEKYLKENEVLVEDIEPSLLVEKTWPKETKEISTQEVLEAFLKYTGVEMITDKEVIRRAIAKGVTTGVFGYGVAASPSEISALKFEVPVGSGEIEVSERAWLLAREAAAKMVGTEGEEKEKIGAGTGTVREKEKGVPRKEKEVRAIRIVIEGIESALTDVIRGVVKPLRDGGAKVKADLSIHAKGDIRDATLKMQVEETLKQLEQRGAKYKLEEEE